ncbi:MULTISPECIES: hypothetical protein [unclassified Corynebacterium]|uniref:DUF6414 family protein n=1 Tax=unclassified Corynebacterium TaxID=2624378 RepID=UPI00114D2E34|nr:MULTISPECIES: hypothetical protein [unclassified Corynebacterium]
MKDIDLFIRPFYLDTQALDDYIAGIENGLTESIIDKQSKTSHNGGSIDAKVISGEKARAETGENTRSFRDHDTAKLDRLIKYGRANCEAASWNEILEPDTSFQHIRTGEMIEWECDVYLSEISEILANNELPGSLRSLAKVAPLTKIFGSPQNDLPDSEQFNQMADFMDGVNLKPILIGEDDATAWRIVGTLQQDHIRTKDGFDDRARIVAKVRKKIPEGRWFSLHAASGIPMSREQRRAAGRKGPSTAEEQNQFLEGPLLVVDYLAVYI